MQPDDITSDVAGHVVRSPRGYWAFIPSRLPPRLDLNPLALQVSEADSALSKLAGAAPLLPNPHLLMVPYINREAIASSQIEGTQATLSDLFRNELDPREPSTTSDVREVQNYVTALELGIKLLDELPLASRLIREMHAVLLRDVRGQNKAPGEFRRTQNWIGGTSPSNAVFVPPPPDHLANTITNWEKFIHQKDILPPLVQCAVMHAAFETMHPFLDGNGRIGRLLITLFLIDRGRLDRPLLYLSSYIEQTKSEYYGRLQRVRTHGDWNGWIAYFLEGIRETASTANRHALALLGLRDDLRGRSDLKGKHRAQNLIDLLFANPFTTVARAATLLDVAEPTADRSIKLLVKSGILRESTGRKYGRVWRADPIFEAIKNPPLE